MNLGHALKAAGKEPEAKLAWSKAGGIGARSSRPNTSAKPSRYHGYLVEKVSSSVRKKALLVVINALSIASLYWALRGSHLSELRDDVATLGWWWVIAAVISGACVYLWQAIRWQTLLRPVEPIGFWETARAIYVGLFANEVLPFRAGELLRCYLLSTRTTLPLSVSITSALLERVFDVIWLCLGMYLVLRFEPIPHTLRFVVDGGYFLAFVVLGAALLLSFALFRRHHARAVLTGGMWQKQLRVLIDDLEIIGHSRYLLLSFLQSLPFLLLQVIPTYAAFRAYGFDLPWSAAFALTIILRIGAVVPQAPGNLGLFQYLAGLSLVRMFNVVPDEAGAASRWCCGRWLRCRCWRGARSRSR